MTEKELRALDTVKKYMWWSMGAGLIPVPFLDMAAVSGVQLKMLCAMSRIYDVPFHETRGRAFIASLGGSIVPQAVSFGAVGSLIKAVPVVGVLAGAPAMALLSGASTWALGKVFILHFESGGTFLDFDPERVRQHFRTEFEEGRTMASQMGPGGSAEAPV